MPQGLARPARLLRSATRRRSIGYLLLLTDRYPNSDPAVYESANVYRSDPIRLHVDDDLRRSRLTVFFRLLLAFPHFVWLLLWGIAGVLRADRELVRDAVPRPLAAGRCTASSRRYLRYQTHVYAFLQLVANPFPGFTGQAGHLPGRRRDRPPERQNRWMTGFRLFLAFPAFMVSGALATAAFAGRDAAAGSTRSPAGGCRAACATSAPSSCATRRRRTATSTCSPTATRTAVRPPGWQMTLTPRRQPAARQT